MKGLDEKVKKDVLEAARMCVRCGACKSVCPTYDVLRREGGGPRGRVSLIEAAFRGEEAFFGPAYARNVKDCTLCGSCYEACPNGVNVPELVLAARAGLVQKEGLPFLASFTFRNLLKSERLTGMAMKFASRFQGLLFRDAATGGGLVSRFSLPLVGSGRLVPELPDEFFTDRRHIRKLARAGEKGKRPRVGFFVGCGINYLLPDIGEATVRVLGESGAEVVVPEGQVCCGMPAVSSGERKAASELAMKNLEAFERDGLDFIVTSCATCGHGLKNMFRTLLIEEGGADDRMRERVERFASKVRDITELLEGELGYAAKGKNSRPERVAYHDPCHLKKYQGITEEPRRLIEKSGVVYTKMKHPCKCCGLGGGLGFTNYELSMRIAGKKAENIMKSGADVLATACPGCIIQLKDALHHTGGSARVVHVVELL